MVIAKQGERMAKKDIAISHHFWKPKYPADSCQVFGKIVGECLL